MTVLKFRNYPSGGRRFTSQARRTWLGATGAKDNAPLNVKPAGWGAGGGRAWGGDLIVFVGPVEGHLTDLVLQGEGIFESFFARRGDI